MWNLLSRVAAAEAELGEVRRLLRDAVEGLQVGTLLMLISVYQHFSVEHDRVEPSPQQVGGSWSSPRNPRRKRLRGNSRGGKLARIAPRWDGLLVQGELCQRQLSCAALFV